MNKLLLGVISLTLSGGVLANQPNTQYSANNKNGDVYIGTSFSDGSFINQYKLTNEGSTTSGMKNSGLTGVDVHVGLEKKAFRIELGIDYLNSQRSYQEYDSTVKENLLKSTSSSGIATLLDGYYDLKFSKTIAAFLGAGAGYLHTFASGNTASRQSGETNAANNVILNAKVGINFSVNPSLQAYAEASTIRLVSSSGSMNSKDHFNAVSVGINYTL